MNKGLPVQDEIISAAGKASIASYTASGGLFIFGMTMNEFAAAIGAACAVATLGINWYYRHKEYSRQK